ncbi:hypothetical protein ACJIZ3_023824 [Penstemon smallii]|uniref:YDG domain-containing protein n=1 Tax=Penstemon smallii TaxID=265156 RepID=A0ABD3TSL0_9LAMI
MLSQNGWAEGKEGFPPKMAREPRINSAILWLSEWPNFLITGGAPKVNHFIHNQDRLDKAFTTDRAKKTGNANACSGKIFVIVPLHHFGPITPENDPERKLGLLVGETWKDRMECRQWGPHFPHVAGIFGQSEHGAQSVALSGGYEDDEEHGEWFLYTGSGGRDLSGNKRINKKQSSETFFKFNVALRVSCRHGYPVRVVSIIQICPQVGYNILSIEHIKEVKYRDIYVVVLAYRTSPYRETNFLCHMTHINLFFFYP